MLLAHFVGDALSRQAHELRQTARSAGMTGMTARE
jgi:hypothetical protein